MQYSPDQPSRFVIIPRHGGAACQDVKMVDTEPFHVSLTNSPVYICIVIMSVLLMYVHGWGLGINAASLHLGKWLSEGVWQTTSVCEHDGQTP